MEQKAQGAIEYLLIIGAAILVVAIVIIAITSVVGTGKTQVGDTNQINSLQCTKDINYLGNVATKTGCGTTGNDANCICKSAGWIK